MKISFEVNKQTKIESHLEEIEPEIAIRTEGDHQLIEIFGTKEDLKAFAEQLYKKTNEVG